MKNPSTLAPPYSATSWTGGNGITVFAVSGELEFYTAPALRGALLQTVSGGSPLVVLDLSKVTFLDSSGVGALVFGCRRAREHHGALALAALSEHVQHVLGVMGLLKVFAVFDTVDKATDGVLQSANGRDTATARRCEVLP